MSETIEILAVGEFIPEAALPGDAGSDLRASEALVIAPGARASVGTGLRVALPRGFAAFVVPRSGLAAKHGITIVNSPGTVDAGYRGEIKVTLLNTDESEPFAVEVGDRIAQMIVIPVSSPVFIPVEHLPESHRGTGGFGSTGKGALGHTESSAS